MSYSFRHSDSVHDRNYLTPGGTVEAAPTLANRKQRYHDHRCLPLDDFPRAPRRPVGQPRRLIDNQNQLPRVIRIRNQVESQVRELVSIRRNEYRDSWGTEAPNVVVVHRFEWEP